MYSIKAFRFATSQVQRLHRAQFEASVINSLNDVAAVSRAHRVGFDDCECKIPHLLFPISLIVLEKFCRAEEICRYSPAALPQMSGARSGSALPPDVRRWLCPADSKQIIPGLSPLYLFGPKAAPRAQPENEKGTSTAGHSHRLTSGGKAEPQQRRTLTAKLCAVKISYAAEDAPSASFIPVPISAGDLTT
jgi:hypothetical protein